MGEIFCMPANLTHQYKEAERRYRQATSPEDQAAALAEMLAVIPKHKGTDKLQADIKRRMAQLRRERPKAGGVARQRPIYVIDLEGAGQVPVLGGPNAGKSALVAAVSNAHVQVADYPYTTQAPAPAMMPFEDTQVQLVDTPPASEEFAPPWIAELVRRADAAIIVADPTEPDGWVAPEWLIEHLSDQGIELVAARTARPEDQEANAAVRHAQGSTAAADDDEDESLTFRVATMIVCMKSDVSGADEGIEELIELFGDRFPVLALSSSDEDAQQGFRRAVFATLEMIRVYSKEPGKPTKKGKPWLLQEGSTVHDLARIIHHDLARNFQYGRLWGSARFEGQRVGEDYLLEDEDVVEIHTS